MLIIVKTKKTTAVKHKNPILIYHGIALPARVRVMPIVFINSSFASTGAREKASSMASVINNWRNNTALWEGGKIFTTVFTASGKIPIGIYIPVKNPIRVPITELAVAKALWVFKKETTKNSITVFARAESNIKAKQNILEYSQIF